MKRMLSSYVLTSLIAISALTGNSQVEIDQPLQLTGSGSAAKVTGIQEVNGPTDAVSAEAIQRGNLVCASTVSGSANAIVLQFTPGISALHPGTMLTFKSGAANTGAVTVDVDGAGPMAAISVKKNVSDDLAADDIRLGQMVSIIYDGAAFQLLAGAGSGGGGAATCVTLPTPIAPAGYTYTGYFQNFTPSNLGLYWTSRASIPRGKVAPAVTVYNSRLYLFGGNASSSTDRPLSYFYNPTTNTWTQITSMPAARWEGIAEVVNGKIYVIGGQAGSSCDVAVNYEFDPVANSWVTKTGTGTLRQMASAVWNNRIYIFGSGGNCCSPCPVNSARYYTPATDTWTNIANMPITRLGCVGGVINDRIYIAGGLTSTPSTGNTDRVHEYNPATNSYTEKAAMPSVRANMAATVFNNKLYVIGGGNQNEAYDPALNLWEVKTNMPTSRSWVGAGTIDGFIYVVAGGSGSSGDATNERYNPANDPGYRYYMHCQQPN